MCDGLWFGACQCTGVLMALAWAHCDLMLAFVVVQVCRDLGEIDKAFDALLQGYDAAKQLRPLPTRHASWLVAVAVFAELCEVHRDSPTVGLGPSESGPPSDDDAWRVYEEENKMPPRPSVVFACKLYEDVGKHSLARDLQRRVERTRMALAEHASHGASACACAATLPVAASPSSD
jgi:hypothetical protein